MYSPILEAIKNYKAAQRAPFHMPGHKSRARFLGPLAAILDLDLTEIPDTGSLFDGMGPTLEAEKLARELFGSAGSFMSAGGCTLCIKTALRLALPQGGKIICGRVIHRSVINTMALLNIDPIWVLPDESAGSCFSGRIEAESVAEALKKNPDAKAVFVTSPDYFGVMSDLKAIGEQAKKHRVPLLVDNAHGAHLYFLGEEYSPAAQGISISSDSAHKTLPVLTGGAWLNIFEESLLTEVREAMALFGSTSPSYPIMLSLDLCRAWLAEEGGARIRQCAQEVGKLKSKLSKMGYILPMGKCDPMRPVFSCENLPLKGEDLGSFLRENKVEPEYVGDEGVILIPSPFNNAEDFEKLEAALTKLAALGLKEPKKRLTVESTEYIPEKLMSPREALFAESAFIPVEAAQGRVAARALCPCPPAIPIVIPGERISTKELKALKSRAYEYVCVVK